MTRHHRALPSSIAPANDPITVKGSMPHCEFLAGGMRGDGGLRTPLRWRIENRGKRVVNPGIYGGGGDGRAVGRSAR